MATPNSGSRGLATAARLTAVALGLAALAWTASVLPLVWGSAAAESFASRFIAGDSFREEALAAAITGRDAAWRWPRPGALRAEAVLRLALADHPLVRTDLAASDARLAETTDATNDALALAPADAYLWLIRYWVADARHGFDPARLHDLATSYVFGPREGWIAIRRNLLGLVLFPRLDGATQQRVVTEFAGMVESNLIAEAAGNLAGPGWTIREPLLASLQEVKLEPKQALQKRLRSEGIRIEVPGVPEQEERPWR